MEVKFDNVGGEHRWESSLHFVKFLCGPKVALKLFFKKGDTLIIIIIMFHILTV